MTLHNTISGVTGVTPERLRSDSGATVTDTIREVCSNENKMELS
jgi:hypothetical protein